MGWFWTDHDHTSNNFSAYGSLPPTQNDSSVAKCPVAHNAPSSLPSSTGRCPVSPASASASDETINPLNQMPTLSQHQISANQAVRLPTDREISTIPKSQGEGGNWEYPSAQQLYNAMVRKGYSQSGEHVESMLSVHNFLNEQAWSEILAWESDAAPGTTPSLTRFTGRPSTLSPKAYFYSTVYGGQTPFDRHDWYVDRGGREVRYVIDYYDAPNDEDGNGVFYLDIRPALDSPSAAYTRIKKWTSETWAKAAGTTGEAPTMANK